MAVHFKATSDFKDVLADYDKLQRKVVGLEEKLRGVTKESRGQQSLSASIGQSMGQAITGAIAGYATLQGAIQLVNSALQEQARLNAEAARTTMTVADAQAEVIKNLGMISTADASSFIKDIEAISKTAGMPSTAPVFSAAAAVLSGVESNQALTKGILAESLPFFKNKPEDLAPFAGAVGDLATIAGATSQQDIRSIVGMVLSTQAQARIVSMEQFKNAAPAIAAGATVDKSGNKMEAIRQSAAMFSAIGGAIKDPEGALTKTAVSEVATALSELLPERNVLDAEGKIKRKGTGLRTMDERLRAVQASPELQRRLFETGEGMQAASFRGPITPVIRDLVSNPESEVAKRYAAAMVAIRPDTSLVDQMRANLEGATPQLALSGSARRVSGAVERAQLSGPSATLGTVAESIQKTFQQTRQNWLLDPLREKVFNAEMAFTRNFRGPDAALQLAEDEIVGRMRGWAKAPQILDGRPATPPTTEEIQAAGPLSEDAATALEVLRALLDEIKLMRSNLNKAGATTAAAASMQDQRER